VAVKIVDAKTSNMVTLTKAPQSLLFGQWTEIFLIVAGD
jgi:hypothetical protein